MSFLRPSRRSRPASPDTAPAVRPEAPRSSAVAAAAQRAQGRLRAPSTLHAFNRYELKYLVTQAQVPAVREHLRHHMDADEHARHGGYDVISLYYDTTGLRFYWEKIEGLKFRRKLRVGHYGDRASVTEDTPVFVEIKQRVNRVTQKRRVSLPYHLARRLCDDREMPPHDPAQRAFLEEVLALIVENDLRPIATTGYQREPFVGRDIDVGLRVTLDHRVRGRDRDFHLGAESENRFTIPPHLAVMEVKANERVPYWVTDMAAALSLSIVRVSKYCQSVETFGKAPRSVFHVPDELGCAPAPPAPPVSPHSPSGRWSPTVPAVPLGSPVPLAPGAPRPVNINLQDLSGTFSAFDVAASLGLSLILSMAIAFTYRATHRNVSYSQSYVQTLVILGMLISLIMLVVGSNIARAFTLVGALSVVRFRNAIKETRDVGFIFLVMGIGMACGTRFYLLAVAATIAICLVIVIMHRFNLFSLNVQRQVAKVQVPADGDYTDVIADVLVRYTTEFELVSTESIRGGALTELFYTVRLKKGYQPGDLVAALRELNAGQRVSVLTGYDQTDL